MLKKLRRKFLFITYLSIFVVVLIIISVINFYNYTSTMQKHENVISLFLDQNNTDETPPIFIRYVVVIDISNKTIIQGDLNEVYDLDTLLFNILKQEKSRGKYQEFAYGIVDERLVLSNTERESQVIQDFFINSLIISSIGILCVYIIIYLFSSYILKPFIKNDENQKQFITNVSHELKTPITIIKANLDVLLIENISNEWTNSIDDQINRLELLTSNLIELSKVEEINSNVIKTEFSLTDAFFEIYNDYKNHFTDKGIISELTCNSNVTFNGNEKQIRDCFKLLFDNILKYTVNNKANIYIDNKEIIFSNSTDLENGNYNQIFNRFTRLDDSRNQSINGYGIGLSIVKKIFDNHQCSLSANVVNNVFIIKIKLK